ncbi:Eukaryotic translation initiation factor 3 subunit J [Talaromyces atroroseus]|uniref:Eukaryotic translation initiation factor 3 subunit J n=1 Tax=Talaromyces atroroseus TaxID=1441469 RepID=A0A225AS66_TALAT|nr:Eukaryotic translation initiation factor 3 subunit J [Talaromyces atroroseus]OKL62343.1 Eukaryotic translation initiation factor 3 subunit J [Talaromyces atroroseus]
MAPSKWDDEEESTPPSSPPVAARRKFDDEEDEEVLDSWDAAEDSDVEREKAAAAAAAKAKAEAEAAAKKKSKAQRIEEHKLERKRLEEEDSSDESSEDEAVRRARLRKTEKDSDLKHAEDLFGDIDLNRTNRRSAAPKAVVVSDASDPTKAIDLSAMPLFKPTTKDQFAKLTSTLIPLLTANSKKVQYALWAPDFAKQLAKDLPSDQVKKIASALTTLSNEKMREERAADKGSKKSKAAKTKTTLNAQRDFEKADINAYDDDDLGDDDFM